MSKDYTLLQEMKSAYTNIVKESMSTGFNEMMNQAILAGDVNKVKSLLARAKTGKKPVLESKNKTGKIMKEEVVEGEKKTETTEKKEEPKKEVKKEEKKTETKDDGTADIWKRLGGKEFHVAMQDPEFQALLKKEMKAQDMKGVMLIFMNLNGAVNSGKVRQGQGIGGA